MTRKDNEDLKLLSIFHYVVGGLGSLFALMPLLHMGIGLFFILAPEQIAGSSGGPPPELFGWLFFLLGLGFFLVGELLAVGIILSGRFIARRKYYVYSFVVACLECAVFPFGTVLGIFTIIVLSRDTVRNYGKTEEPPTEGKAGNKP